MRMEKLLLITDSEEVSIAWGGISGIRIIYIQSPKNLMNFYSPYWKSEMKNHTFTDGAEIAVSKVVKLGAYSRPKIMYLKSVKGPLMFDP